MSQTGKTPSDSAVVTRYLVMPQQANPQGTAFGGAIMGWIDMVAAMAAERHCGTEVVTVRDVVEVGRRARATLECFDRRRDVTNLEADREDLDALGLHGGTEFWRLHFRRAVVGVVVGVGAVGCLGFDPVPILGVVVAVGHENRNFTQLRRAV